MFKISSTTYHHNFLLKIGLAAMAGLMGQTALAACPAVNDLNDLVRVNQNSDVDGSTIYFCKSPYSPRDPKLEFKVKQENLITGGSQVISQSSDSSSNTIHGFPSNVQIDLGSFDLSATNLKPGTLTAAFPSGKPDTSHLFNFYTRKNIFRGNAADSQNACGDPGFGQYKMIEEYLKTHSETFVIGSTYNSVDSNPSEGFLKFSGVKLASSIAPSSNLTADLYFYHMNDKDGQFFTRNAPFVRSYVYCWYGVRAELEIKHSDSGANIQHAGEYLLNIGVNTQ